MRIAFIRIQLQLEHSLGNHNSFTIAKATAGFYRNFVYVIVYIQFVYVYMECPALFYSENGSSCRRGRAHTTRAQARLEYLQRRDRQTPKDTRWAIYLSTYPITAQVHLFAVPMWPSLRTGMEWRCFRDGEASIHRLYSPRTVPSMVVQPYSSCRCNLE